MRRLSRSAPGLLAWTAVAVAIGSCSLQRPAGDRDGPGDGRDLSQVPDAVPHVEPRSRGGNPKSYVVFGKRYYTLPNSRGYVERGIASWYGSKFHGRNTSNGEVYDMYSMTAAHKRLPLPTYVEVVNLENNRRAVVRVNDRGPFHDNRVIDMSYAAAWKLGMLGKGTALVEIRAIDPRSNQPTSAHRKVTARRPAATASVERAPRIYLQAGAFSVADNARRLRNRLETGLARSVRVVPVQTGSGQLHRVQVGPLASVEIADRVSSDMHGLGVAEPVVVID